MSFSSHVKEELSYKAPKSRHCKLALLAGLSSEYKTAELSKECCKRAYLKGAFLAAGSISDPNKDYHFEIVVSDRDYAEWLLKLIGEFEVTARISSRKDNYIVYVKDASEISNLLGIMDATVSMMELENVRIVKEVRNSVNRQVNCDIANNAKAIGAARHQIEAIEYIKEHAGLDSLKPELAEIAELRLENPEVPLKELGQMLQNPIGKSGVNHRLVRLCEMAEGLRKQQESVALVAKEEKK